MLSFIVPVVLASIIAWTSNYAPLTLLPPYQQFGISFNVSLGRLGELNGPLAINTDMQEATLLFKDAVVDPETLVFDYSGRMYLFTEKGIYRATPKGDSFKDLELFLVVEGGRPLSGAFDSSGMTLYVCDSILGLGRVDIESQKFEIVLSKEELYFCDDIVVSSTDEIFIADATSMRVSTPDSVLATSLRAVATNKADGRLLKYTPASNKLETLIPNITFANGVSLSHDESFVLVSESGAALRIIRFWLKGPKAGMADTFVDGLPGYSDGVSQGSDGTYWIAIFSRIDVFHSIILRFRLLRWIGTMLPYSLAWKLINKHDMILQVNEDGRILRSLQDPSSQFGRTTSIAEHKGKLYIGSFAPVVKVIDLASHPLKA